MALYEANYKSHDKRDFKPVYPVAAAKIVYHILEACHLDIRKLELKSEARCIYIDLRRPAYGLAMALAESDFLDFQTLKAQFSSTKPPVPNANVWSKS